MCESAASTHVKTFSRKQASVSNSLVQRCEASLSDPTEAIYVLWVVLDEEDNMVAAITTRIATYPRRKAMVLDFVGGTKLHKWKDTVIETIGRFAKENDCQHLEGYGRKGWERALRGNGFYSEYIAYRMEL